MAPGGHILSSAAPLDEFSPYYLQNIEYFHSLGGFQAIVSRLSREPRVHFNGVRLLLRPFRQVKGLLSRHAMREFMRAVRGTLLDLVEAMTDEQLKMEDRKSFQELHKLIDGLFHGSKMYDAVRSLDDFSLAFTLKCLRSQMLEKRLGGLQSSKRSSLCHAQIGLLQRDAGARNDGGGQRGRRGPRAREARRRHRRRPPSMPRPECERERVGDAECGVDDTDFLVGWLQNTGDRTDLWREGLARSGGEARPVTCSFSWRRAMHSTRSSRVVWRSRSASTSRSSSDLSRAH